MKKIRVGVWMLVAVAVSSMVLADGTVRTGTLTRSKSRMVTIDTFESGQLRVDLALVKSGDADLFVLCGDLFASLDDESVVLWGSSISNQDRFESVSTGVLPDLTCFAIFSLFEGPKTKFSALVSFDADHDVLPGTQAVAAPAVVQEARELTAAEERVLDGLLRRVRGLGRR